MKIAICDDNQKELHMISELIGKYQAPDETTIHCDTYQNALDLMASLTSNDYDVLLLDILMPGFSGMEAARELRQSNNALPIIFLTSSPEFAVDSYRVHAFDYLLKPVQPEHLYESLDRIRSMKDNHLVNSITLKTAKAVYILSLSQIEYVEINNRTLTFHLINNTEKSITGRLADYEPQLLAHREFLKIHRSYIINMNLMKALNKKCFLTLSGKELPISRNLLPGIQKTYMDHIHEAIRQ